MMIEIPSLKERPLKEKLQFIRLFFWMESRRLNAPVLVRAEVIRYMADEEYQGNVGQLKADIQGSAVQEPFWTAEQKKIKDDCGNGGSFWKQNGAYIFWRTFPSGGAGTGR